MQWNNSTLQSKILDWRVFRSNLEALTLEEQLRRIAEYFSTIPTTSRLLDYYDSSTWPTPWEILDYSVLDANYVSLLMYHTLKLINVSSELHLIESPDNKYIVLLVEQKYLLNYIHKEVVNLNDYVREIKFLEKHTGV